MILIEKLKHESLFKKFKITNNFIDFKRLKCVINIKITYIVNIAKTLLNKFYKKI